MRNSILFLTLICASCSAPQDTLLEQYVNSFHASFFIIQFGNWWMQ